ncbi:MAG: AsnC family transcriptional regulator [Thermoplasmatota archaeon]
MDEIDIRISFELFFNGRMPYRELADKMGMSSIAVHKRVANLMDIGIIRGFRASPSVAAVGGVLVAVSGTGTFDDVDPVIDELERDGRAYKLIRSPGGFLFVEGILRDISDLDDFTTRVISTCGIKNPRILIPHLPSRRSAPRIELSTTDRSIIKALSNDCRRPLNEVAGALGISTRTVKRRLDRMIGLEAVELRAEMVPTASGDIISFLFLYLSEDADRDLVAHRLRSENFPRVMTTILFSNEPGLIIANCWAGSMKATEDLKKDLSSRYPVDRIDLNVLYDMHFIKSWKDLGP